ncbi:MAG: alcohol dehydrogenase catalytic domain-containing protein [Nitriliruptor sp.]
MSEIRAVVHAATPGDGRPGHLRAVGRPAPEAGSGQVVVDVHAALLAPGDPPPLVDGTVVGREAAGVVAAIGPDVAGLAVGDAVALPTLLTCARCPACRAGRTNLCSDGRRPGVDVDGWLAEQVVVSAHLLIPRPASVPAALAASVPGVVAAAYNAVKRAGVGPGVSVAVLGAGALGTQVTQLAALAGGEVTVVDARGAARELAEDLGADATVDPAGRSLATVIPEPVERVIVTPDHPAQVTQGIEVLAPGGRLVFAELPVEAAGELPTDRLVRDELDIVGASGGTSHDALELFDLAAESRLILSTTVGEVHPVAALEELEPQLADASVGARVAIDPRPDPV